MYGTSPLQFFAKSLSMIDVTSSVAKTDMMSKKQRLRYCYTNNKAFGKYFFFIFLANAYYGA